jgi:ferredoxin-thioredoxin reductase catalytic subunit
MSRVARQERDVSGVLVGIGHQGGARYGSSQRDGRTELLKVQSEEGQNANFCPFGCQDDELDEQGYCYHLIGFSPDGKKLELNKVGEDGRVRTIAPVKKVNGRFTIVHDARVERRKHLLVPIVKNGSYRVYEDIPRPDDYPEQASDELTDEELDAIDAEEGEPDDEPDDTPNYAQGERVHRRRPVAEDPEPEPPPARRPRGRRLRPTPPPAEPAETE